MLDFTHVLAGPRSARTLAEYGAEVLHISWPWFADTLAQHLGVDAGKHDAYLDLRYGKDMVTMRHLAATADVFASTYRPAVNKRFGLLPDQLAAASERGIVYMSATAYGHSGPWKDRPGFDQNGQVASGFVMAEGQGGPPRFSPVFYLADLITGHFAAAGMMAALYRRAIEGGSYQVKLSLARSAMWVQDLGLLDVAAQGEVPETDSYPAETVSIDTAYGTVTSLAPALTFTSLTLPATGRLVPYGAGPRVMAVGDLMRATAEPDQVPDRVLPVARAPVLAQAPLITEFTYLRSHGLRLFYLVNAHIGSLLGELRMEHEKVPLFNRRRWISAGSRSPSTTWTWSPARCGRDGEHG